MALPHTESNRSSMARLLLVEDNDAQRFTLTSILEREGCEVVACRTGAEALKELDHATFGVAVVDLRIPDIDGTDVLAALRQRSRTTRVIVNTAHGSFDSAKESVNMGAFAYVEKAGDPADLVRHVHRAFREQMDRYAENLEQTVSEHTLSLRESEERFRQLAENIDQIFWMSNSSKTHILYVSPTFERISGRSVQSFYDDPDSVAELVHPEDRPRTMAALERQTRGIPTDMEYRILREDGTIRWLRTRSFPIYNEQGKFYRIAGVCEDISERKRVEDEHRKIEDHLRQFQKMESLGTLAAGVAHDFNNLLTAMTGYAELARNALPDGHPALKSIDGILDAVQLAVGVTGSLLTFSRKEVTTKVPVHLGSVLTDCLRMLRRMLPANITVESDIPDDDRLWVQADPTQIQQVVMNLAVNARDAMPQGGPLRLTLSYRPPRANDLKPAEPGEIGGTVLLAVADEGNGISEDVRSRMFDPFFTTKLRGQGAGLGMAVVHGIVTDHQGRITVESSEGNGATIVVELPHCEPSADSVHNQNVLENQKGNGEFVLVGEDNGQVRSVLVSTLRSFGYEVEAAFDGETTMKLFDKRQDSMNLVLLDLDMPKMGGATCLKSIRKRACDVPVVLMTARPNITLPKNDSDNTTVLHKPFQISELMSAIRRALPANPQREEPSHEQH